MSAHERRWRAPQAARAAPAGAGPVGQARPAPRAVQAPYFPADEETDRHRRIVSSSPLKRIEDEERELQRRQESARFGLRLTIMGLIVLVAFSAVVVRLWSLQVLHSSHYRERPSSYRRQTVPITPARGLILVPGGEDPRRRRGAPRRHLEPLGGDPGRHRAPGGPARRERGGCEHGSREPSGEPLPARADRHRRLAVDHGLPVRAREPVPRASRSPSPPSAPTPTGDTAAQVLGYTGDIDASRAEGPRQVRLHGERRHRPGRARVDLRAATCGASRARRS